jgi:hypothetical protein
MGWVVSVTPRPRFTHGERTPVTHWIGGGVGLRAGSDTEATWKIIASAVDRTPVGQSVVTHYTDWATPAHIEYTYVKMFAILTQVAF